MTEYLSSDILENQFGPTELEVLYQDAATRVICTKTVGSGQVLELSLVSFVPAGVERFADVHQAILAGESIGKAFRAAGVQLNRDFEGGYKYALPASFEQRFASREPATVVDVAILVGEHNTPYARILETYSPEVEWKLREIEPTPDQLARIQLLDELLKTS